MANKKPKYQTLPAVTVNAKTKYKTLPNVNVSSKKKSPIKQAVESSAIQMYNPFTGTPISTANPGQTKRQIKESTSNIKGNSLKDSIKELTAMTQFAPMPFVSIPSAIINSGIGMSDALDAQKQKDQLNENINSAGAMPWQYMIPGPVGKVLEAVSAAADLTDNFGLEQKKNGGWLDEFQDGGKKGAKKKVIQQKVVQKKVVQKPVKKVATFADSPYKEVDASSSNLFRRLMPLPDNASQMLAKTVFGDARMNNESLSDKQKMLLWKVIQNAKARTGKDNSGTEYQDYGDLGYGSSDDFVNWFNKGKSGAARMAWNSLTNEGYNLASTIGRGRYWTDPNSGDVYYTDVYDWNAGEKNFKGDNIYQNLRNAVRGSEDKNLNKEKNENYRMNFHLSKKEMNDMIGEQQQKENATKRFEEYQMNKFFSKQGLKNGGWLDEFEYGGQAGYTDKGFNYNSAWGGQFQDGGKLTPEQLASLNKAKMKAKMALAAEWGNPSARRMMNPTPPSYRFSGNEMYNGKPVVGFGEDQAKLGDTGTHRMTSIDNFAVPYIQQNPNGTLFYNQDPSPKDREAIRFGNPQDAEYFAEHYKEVAPMMKNYAMGGSLPGSVGFTYARTGAPSNGPYAKKTLASAQNGKTATKEEPLGPTGFLNSYFQSPTFKSRLNGSNKDYADAMELFNYHSKRNSPYVNTKDDGEGSHTSDYLYNVKHGFPEKTSIILSPSQANRLGSDLWNDVYPHEYSHLIRQLSPRDQMLFAQYDNNPMARVAYDRWKNSTSQYDFNSWLNTAGPGAHDQLPSENYSDLNSLRWLMYKQGIYDTRKGPMTEEHIKKAMKDPYIMGQHSQKRFFKRYNPKNIVKLNNEVAQNDGADEMDVARDGSMTYYQEGLDWKPKGMKNGGKNYKVDKSNIEGVGVFAKKNLKPGDYIGKVHTINELFTDYDFTDLGKNHNHSDNPNAQNVMVGNERHLVAIKPIKKGTELTTNYRLQPDLEQPENFGRGGWLDSL